MLRALKNRLVDLSLPPLADLPPEADNAARQAAKEFVAAATAIAPHHVRLGAELLVLTLWLWTLPVGGLPVRQTGFRWRWAQAFTRLPGPGGMIFRLFGNLAAFAYFEHPDVARHFGLTPTSDRQAMFRQKAHVGE